jgi:hypothetical protein
MTMQPAVVSQKDIEAYHRDGVVVLRGLLTSKQVQDLQRDGDKTICAPGPLYEIQDKGNEEGGGVFHDDMQMWLRLPAMRHACLSSVLAQAAQELMTVQNSDGNAGESNMHPGERTLRYRTK